MTRGATLIVDDSGTAVSAGAVAYVLSGVPHHFAVHVVLTAPGAL